MSLPTWMTDNLAGAAYLVQVHATQPVTIVVTPTSLTLCAHNGETYQLPPLTEGLLTGSLPVTQADAQDGVQAGQPGPPAPQELPATEASQMLQPISNPDASPPTTIPDARLPVMELATPGPSHTSPEPPTRASRLADDLNSAARAEVPSLAQPNGTIQEQFRAYARRLAQEDRKTRKDRHLQLHLAYVLGQMYNGHRRTIHRYLPSLIQEDRQRRRLTSAITRAHRLVERCGLPRIYGSTQLTLADVRAMTTDEFAEDFLPAIQEEVVSLDNWDSEGFVSSGGGNVTP